MESSFILNFLLKIVTIHGIFYLLYFALLRNKTSHRLNRTYLLTTLLVAFFIPALELSIPEDRLPILSETPTFQWEEELAIAPIESINFIEQEVAEKPTDYWALAKWAYLILSLGLVLRSFFHLIILQKLKYQSEYVEKQWFRLFKTSQTHPFSFLSNVFIPKFIFGTNSFEQILEHECEHVRQRHSVDRLLLDFIVALFWFNPFIFLYRKALIEIHEYQADAAVLRKFPDPIKYQEVLFSQLSTASYSGLVSHFNFSTIKKRIVMINKQNNKRSIWAYALAVPVTLWVILAFSGRVQESLLPETKEVKQGEVRPSIGPVKDSDLVRLSSGFGMRMHPIYKVRKMHNGVDFAVAEGSEVVATADGKVSKTETTFGGYGKKITIAHGKKYQTMYGQLSLIKVKEGDTVKKGQLIGLSGNSGASTAPHLHYEVIEVGVGYQDPVEFIDNLHVREVEDKGGMMEISPKAEQEEPTPAILPIDDSEDVRMTSGFGMRMHPVMKERKMHLGIDFAAPIGTPIFAGADGTVSEVTSAKGGYGKKILIDHGSKYQTKYAHLSTFEVKKGDRVKKGQTIGLSGNSGMSSIPHLHYEVIRVGQGHVDPKKFINNYDFDAAQEKEELPEDEEEAGKDEVPQEGHVVGEGIIEEQEEIREVEKVQKLSVLEVEENERALVLENALNEGSKNTQKT